MLVKRILFFAVASIAVLLSRSAAAVESTEDHQCDDQGHREDGRKENEECASASSAASDDDAEYYTIAVCTSTGNQGRELLRRLKEMMPRNNKNFRVIGLTRSPAGKGMADAYVQTNYTAGSLREVLSSNDVDALFLNYVAIEEEPAVEAGIIDAAVDARVKHIVYSSTVGCDEDTGVGHWESKHITETYLKKAEEEAPYDLKYHFVRLGHFNENILPGSYMEPKKGKLKYLWDANVAFPTSSMRDSMRVVAKLFADPSLLTNGGHIDAVTEMVTVDRIAKAISAAKNETIVAVKGPWFFLKFGRLFGWMPRSLLAMAKYMENPGCKANLGDMPSLLGNDELEEEPLETVEKFAARHYG